LAGDIQEAAIEKLGRLRESGEDPAHTPAANRKRAESVSDKYALRKEWVRNNPGKVEAERERFKREIFPQLADVAVRSIARACDCSLGYASKIRSGEYVPPPMHNEALERLLRNRN